MSVSVTKSGRKCTVASPRKTRGLDSQCDFCEWYSNSKSIGEVPRFVGVDLDPGQPCRNERYLS